jgi:hypothetical protein
MPINAVNVYGSKKTHGGKRKGAGRKKKDPTKTIRVPVSMINAIKALVEKLK